MQFKNPTRLDNGRETYHERHQFLLKPAKEVHKRLIKPWKPHWRSFKYQHITQPSNTEPKTARFWNFFSFPSNFLGNLTQQFKIKNREKQGPKQAWSFDWVPRKREKGLEKFKYGIYASSFFLVFLFSRPNRKFRKTVTGDGNWIDLWETEVVSTGTGKVAACSSGAAAGAWRWRWCCGIDELSAVELGRTSMRTIKIKSPIRLARMDGPASINQTIYGPS